jgi:hypothetical protein
MAACVPAVAALIAALLAPLVASRVADAQPVTHSARFETAVRTQPDPADDTRWRVDRCLLGLGYHSLTRFTASAAGGLRRAFEPRSVCAYGAAHVGLGGAQAAVGSAVTLGRLGSAVGVTGGLLRAFGRPGGDAVPWRSYAGGSLHLWPLLGIHTEIGAYQRLGDAALAAADGASRRLLVWSVGFGY